MQKLKLATIRTRTTIPTVTGKGEFVSFEGLCDGKEHIAIVFGDLLAMKNPIVRLHSECLTGDVFGSAKCDCGDQLQEAMRVTQRDNGIILYLRQEGRGIGLYNKLETYVLQNQGLDTYTANRALGFDKDCRDYSVAAQMLKAMGIYEIRLLSNNKDKASQLESMGIRVKEQIPTGAYFKQENTQYLLAKINQTNHTISYERSV